VDALCDVDTDTDNNHHLLGVFCFFMARMSHQRRIVVNSQDYEQFHKTDLTNTMDFIGKTSKITLSLYNS
jgi:hypothetical protein